MNYQRHTESLPRGVSLSKTNLSALLSVHCKPHICCEAVRFSLYYSSKAQWDKYWQHNLVLSNNRLRCCFFFFSFLCSTGYKALPLWQERCSALLQLVFISRASQVCLLFPSCELWELYALLIGRIANLMQPAAFAANWKGNCIRETLSSWVLTRCTLNKQVSELVFRLRLLFLNPLGMQLDQWS